MGSGETEVSVGGHPIDLLQQGDILGEMAILDEAPRSATARAVQPCKLVAVDRNEFARLVERTPFFAIQVMQVMADRLRRQMAAGSG